MIWLGIALVTLLVLALLLLPLLRREPDQATTAKAHRAVFLAQLAELEREAAEGRLTKAELAGARLEIQRRLLAVGEDQPPTGPVGSVRRLALPLVMLVLTPALLLYVWQGAPDLPDQPARLRPEIATSQGEALVTAAEGRVTAEAAQAFGRALAIDASDPKAQYYLALAKAQEGDLPAAIAAWQKLLAQATPQAAWRRSVEMSIAEAARMLNRDPAEFGVAAPPPPAAPAVDSAMINDMVARLEARLQDKPDDVEGWLRLGKSWEVLGNKAKSLAAYAQAADRAPQRADVLMSYARALYPPDSDVPPPPDFIALLRRVLALEPDQPEALWFIGHVEADAGNKDTARKLWQKLRDGLPPDSPPRKAVEKALQGLG